MNHCGVSDQKLIQRADVIVREEREILLQVLHHLHEIDRRRLYSELGFKSLFEMCVKRFSYSEDQAYRRIQAMRLMREIPEVEEKISSGEMSLTLIGVAQTFFNHEKKSEPLSRSEKTAVLKKISNMSVREAEKVTRAMSSSPETLKPDRVNAVSETAVEMRFVASAQLNDKIEKLRGLLAHSLPNAGLGEILDKACELAIGAIATEKASGNSAAIRKRRVTIKLGHEKCSQCSSKHALEVDPILPRAKGGTDEPENLRILCRSCNQRAAIKEFGVKKMEKHLL